MFLPQTEIIFAMQSLCRIAGRPPNWILSTKVFPQFSQKRWMETLLFTNSITQTEIFLPKTKIFFVIQSLCRIDSWPPNWILSRKVFPHLSQKTGWIRTLFWGNYITPSERFMPQTEFFFTMQSLCRIDGRPPNRILSTKVSPQLSQKRLYMNHSFGARCLCPRLKYFLQCNLSVGLTAGLQI
jgi:hypothetical protein